eukprot:scaffold98815_cov42-Phaeocystis_antarctica.AAC.1
MVRVRARLAHVVEAMVALVGTAAAQLADGPSLLQRVVVPDQLGAHQSDVGVRAKGVEECTQRVAADEGVVVEEEE